jgi:hypothetical protein
MIDFGETRGADRLYDFGHALLHDSQPDCRPIFSPLLAGYPELASLAAGARAEIKF